MACFVASGTTTAKGVSQERDLLQVETDLGRITAIYVSFSASKITADKGGVFKIYYLAEDNQTWISAGIQGEIKYNANSEYFPVTIAGCACGNLGSPVTLKVTYQAYGSSLDVYAPYNLTAILPGS